MRNWVILAVVALVAAGTIAYYKSQLDSIIEANERAAEEQAATSSTVRHQTIAITSPTGGEILTTGQKFSITWKSDNIQEVFLSLVNGGKEFGTIGPIPADSGRYEWTVPDMSGWYRSGLDQNNFKIFIYSTEGPDVRDVSSSTFSILSVQ
jgi:hypothetical protein